MGCVDARRQRFCGVVGALQVPHRVMGYLGLVTRLTKP
jgi:hypothetical protein